MDVIEQSVDFTENVTEKLKPIILGSMEYSEIQEDGTRIKSLTPYGELIYDVIYKEFKKHLENETNI